MKLKLKKNSKLNRFEIIINGEVYRHTPDRALAYECLTYLDVPELEAEVAIYELCKNPNHDTAFFGVLDLGFTHTDRESSEAV